MLILAAIFFLGMIAWLSFRKLQHRRERDRRLDAQSGFQRRIQRDPGNAAAYEGLGDSYREDGRLAEAMAAYQTALETAGDRSGVGSVRYKMRLVQIDIDWATRKRETPPTMMRGAGRARDLLACVHCGAANPLTSRTCEECGNELLHDTMLSALRSFWMTDQQRKETLEGAAVIAIPVLCIAFAAHLSLEVKGVLIISTVLVGGCVFLNSFSGDRY